MLDAIQKEVILRHKYLVDTPVRTVYFGGGTPSLLNAGEINDLFEALHKYHTISEEAEITLEANPDDLTKDYLKELRQTPVNRLSIGIQSFDDADLRYMNRAHNASEAKSAISIAQSLGFNNLSADLIYGAPTTSDITWEKNIQTVLDFDIPHISCYALTVEPQTALAHFIKSGKSIPPDEATASRQFYLLTDTLSGNDYEHYEISNFARPGFYSKHNTSYWLGLPYLGIGPSAHSFNGQSRSWNIANNAKYIQAINNGTTFSEEEHLSDNERFNEYVMTSLRTMWGCDASRIETFGAPFSDAFKMVVNSKIDQGLISLENGHYKLTRKGKFLADGIISDLFFV